MKGIVFDIQRCSLQDGPGIRSTVFLKGCPLRCLWCHNPESQSYVPELMYHQSLCISCERCSTACKHKCHYFENHRHMMNRERCNSCGDCANRCPTSALEIKGCSMSIDEVLTEVLADREYYENSSGGVTLSGGEPLTQLDFTYELLSALKAEGIHTCVETCGWTTWVNLKKILPVTDLFLYDYKATDLFLHQRLTGHTNELILENLNMLLLSNAKVVLRCPLVPGINDDEEHLKAIASMSHTSGIYAVEVMPYHNLGLGKETGLGRIPTLANLETVDEATQEHWLQKLRSLGCINVRIS